MITHLEIKNFQKWTLNRIIFDPHITTIVGPSDAGKSAIIRALRWICTNKPRGNFIIKNGTDFAEARVKLSDSNSVKRKKSKKENLYFLNKEVYKAFSAQVPEQITTALNLSEINFQQQFDAAYWFHLSPGEVAKEINKIVDLTKADEALAYIKTDIRTSKDFVRVIEASIDRIDNEIEELSYIKEIDKNLFQLEKSFKEVTKIKNWIAEITENLSICDHYERTITLEKTKKSELDQLCKLGKKIKEKSSLKRIIQKEIQDYKNSYDENDDKIVSDLEEMFLIGSEIKKTMAQESLLKKSLNLISKCNTDISEWKQQCSSYEDKLKDLENVCSECGRPL